MIMSFFLYEYFILNCFFLSKILISIIRKNFFYSVVRSEGKYIVFGCFICYYFEICLGNDYFKNIRKLFG